MGSVLRRLAVFLVCALSLGLPAAIVLLAVAGWAAAVAGLLLGAAAGAGVVAADVAGQRRSPGPSRSASPRQRLVVRSAARTDALGSALREAVFRLHALTEQDALPHGPLVARTAAGAWSWGERLTVELRPGDGGTDVVLRSEPVRRALVDYGKGRRNVNALAAAVEALAGPQAAASRTA
jgi:hypothetical protein